MRIEEKFENQMLNIEMQVVTVANADSRLSDFQVEKVYNAFVRKYKALLMGREAKEVSLPSPAGDLYELIEVVCNLFTEDDANYLYGLIKEPLPYNLNPFKMSGNMNKALEKMMPKIKRERPEIINKFQSIMNVSLDTLLASRIRGCFPNR